MVSKSCRPAIPAPRLGACRFAEDPSRPASQARIFWEAEADPHVVTIHVEPAVGANPDAVDVFTLGLPITLLRQEDGIERLLIRDGHRHLRIDVVGGTALAGPIVPRFCLGGMAMLGPRLLALRRLRGVLRLGRLPRALYPGEVRAPRWAAMLQALDGLADGASHHDIAITLFGEKVVAEEWRGVSDHLRLKVQRLTREARRLAAGGYRTILQGPDPL